MTAPGAASAVAGFHAATVAAVLWVQCSDARIQSTQLQQHRASVHVLFFFVYSLKILGLFPIREGLAHLYCIESIID